MRSLNYLVPRLLRKILNPPAIENSTIDKTARCDIGTVVNNSSLGKYSYIGEYTHLIHTEVGAFSSISNYCAIGGGAHPIDWVSMSPAFNDSAGMMKRKLGQIHYDPFKKTIIGNDVWIGSHCLIKAGVTIGDGAVVGMGSIVTHDIGDYEIWAGNPAKKVKNRFDETTSHKLKQIRWWEWPEKRLLEYANLFNKKEEFIRQVENNDENSTPLP